MTTFPKVEKDKNETQNLVFEGNPFECRLSFYGRGQNIITPTLVKNVPNLHKGDLFVVVLDEKDTQRVLLQVEEEKVNQSGPAEIQIDESIKKIFNVSTFMKRNYTIQKVSNKESFGLYLIEVQIKEQYLSRGDMWRFTRKLINTTVYFRKPLDVFNMRATVYGLWTDSAPYRVSSGYITKNTKVVFRSLSTCCTIFLQMSKEMWDFDHQGDTYYEKAVDGFLFDLFTRWKSMSCQHDVTMTLFSRVFYHAKTISEFPKSLHDHINVDHNGRFYEDFYRVIYQNERYDDWLPRLRKIKEVIVDYRESIVNYHRRRLPKNEEKRMPKATISSAAEGNFLETLNLSSTVFERHYIDRSFDRLGQMSVIITPGAGVFEVDRALANMTKQRVLDNGIGSDLVCLGQQPLFAVPLFKFIKKDQNTADNFQIPHWMNLSYYHSSTAPSCFKRYIPRLQFDTSRIQTGTLNAKIVMNSIYEDSFVKPPHLSMEEYDNRVFGSQTKSSAKKGLPEHSIKNGERIPRTRHITVNPTCSRNDSLSSLLIDSSLIEDDELISESDGSMVLNGKMERDIPHLQVKIKDDNFLSTSHRHLSSLAGSNTISNTLNQMSQVLFYDQQSINRVAQSAHTYFLDSYTSSLGNARPKALTNPFAPASIQIPMAPGRRRWAHTFPMGPDNIPWHFHHVRNREKQSKMNDKIQLTAFIEFLLPGTIKKVPNSLFNKAKILNGRNQNGGVVRNKRILSPPNIQTKQDSSERKDSCIDENRSIISKKSNIENGQKISSSRKKKQAIIWGPTGVEPWSATMITSIDWKSLTIPASLPTTFDVVPPEEEFQRDYIHNSYTLIVVISASHEYDPQRRVMLHGTSTSEKNTSGIDPMEIQRILFEELIDHRLSQGFQLITEIPKHIELNMKESIHRANCHPTDHNRLLSIGRIYHTVSLVKIDNMPPNSMATLFQQYKPQHTTKPESVKYKYRMLCPDFSDYDPIEYDLKIESLESFPWNRIDNVVINHGTGDHKLSDTNKFWHTRLVIMPVSRDNKIRNIEIGQTQCDCRQEMTHEDYFRFVEHFVRFLFMLNKLIRVASCTHEAIHRPLDPVTGKKQTEPTKCSEKITANFRTFRAAPILNGDKGATQNFLDLLRDDQQGLLFVSDAILPGHSFIAIEAIWWAIQHGEDIDDEQNSLELFQKLFDLGFIRHCTNIERSFRFGFFLYFIVGEQKTNFSLQSNDYAEVEFHQTQSYIPSMDYLSFGQSKPMRLLPKFIPTSSSSSIVLKRDCNVDVDPKNISDRHEWATAHYHSYYNPHCLFELEIRWLVATSCILGDLINQWSQRTGTLLGLNHVAFHLIPIPCDPFSEFDALRGPIYITMNTNCLTEQLSALPSQVQSLRLSAFQELILKRFGFILNACVSYEHEKIYYVHISGGMLVYMTSDVYNPKYKRVRRKETLKKDENDAQIGNIEYGFYWCWNYCLGKRWRSPHTGEEKYQDMMLQHFRAFCNNDEDRLVQYWNELDQKAKEKLTEKDNSSVVNGRKL